MIQNSITTQRRNSHTDHLASSAWITDRNGMGVQHLQYLPFGEPWVNQQHSQWSAPYTFSGKERDEETGYSYFGARYYDSDLSIWLSVDPLASKYPSLSPYVYCANNPIRLIDPDGRDIINVDNMGRTTITRQEGNDILKSAKTGKTQELSGNGVFDAARSETKDENGNVISTTLSGMSKDDALSTFNFMGDNTDVEWGRMEVGNGDGSVDNFVGTSHDTHNEANISQKIYDPINVLKYDHSHPLDAGNKNSGYRPSGEDLNFWDDLNKNHPNASAGIRFNGTFTPYYKKDGEKHNNYFINKPTSPRP